MKGGKRSKLSRAVGACQLQLRMLLVLRAHHPLSGCVCHLAVYRAVFMSA
jgi:CO dehydrogenase nickel-insertion accessory protein CooC1